jgi:hypothetical protein
LFVRELLKKKKIFVDILFVLRPVFVLFSRENGSTDFDEIFWLLRRVLGVT